MIRVLDIAVAIKAAGGSVEIVRSLAPGVARARRRASAVRDAKQVLGLADPKGDAYRSDAVHPLYTAGRIHPDNEAALIATGSDALVRGPSLRDELRTNAAGSSLLLFGSPTSEGLSRIVFGYEELDGGEGLVWRDPPLDLAYVWELDPGRLGDGRVGRFVPGKGVVERPLWRIKDLRRSEFDYLTPESDGDELLSEDYLLVTRLRNFLSESGPSRGQFLVSFGGAHGTGTRAVQVLLKDRALLQQVSEQLRRKHSTRSGRQGGLPKAYQLLFRVSRIKHDVNGSIPRALELVDATVLSDAEAIWDNAYRRVLPRLEQWHGVGGKSVGGE
jgi:hypothetical protein